MTGKHFYHALALTSTLLLSACTSTENASPHARQLALISEQAMSSDLAYQVVKSLTVEVGPRIAGSEGDKRAVLWAENKFKELGFDKIYKEPVRVRNWSRGIADAKVISPYQQKLFISALGGSVATPEGGLITQVVMFDSLASLKQAETASVQGKIVFINQRMQRDRAGKGYGPVVIGRSQGAIEAAKLGAKAVLIRSVGTDNSRFAHTGVMQYSEKVEKIPAGALSNADADNLEAMLAASKDVTLAVEMRAKEHGWQTSYNVIGEFTGSEHPEEIVLIGAHLDSWDEGTGALDDGAGVGIVTGAAKLINSLTGQPKRTIRVVLYASEEFGLTGAQEYTRRHKAELGNIIVAAESDFGAGEIYQIDTLFAPDALQAAKPLFTALARIGVKQGNNQAGGGPDVSMLPKHGVPVVSLLQDGTYYFDYHHTANDTLDKVDPKSLAQNQAAYALLTYFMANADVDTRPAPASESPSH
ncbi:MAG: M28 family peptidase [Paraglaciecola polaris]|uniref:M28 family peptidase n=1 Tax=Paraglaciecola polaris TaxID=222814 RepID=UPI0030022D4E